MGVERLGGDSKPTVVKSHFPIVVVRRYCDFTAHIITQNLPTISHTHSIIEQTGVCEVLMAARVGGGASNAIAMGNPNISMVANSNCVIING